jgi:tetratricopeptide (TPR) repeat protein
MKIRYFYILITLVMLSSSCGRKIVPATVKKDDGYDAAAFDYVYVEAIKQKNLGNFGDALKYFEQCLKINPKSDPVYYQMGQIIASGGDLNSAKKFVQKAIAIDDKNMWYLVSLSGLYYQEKNLDSAIIYYEKAVNYFPENENIQLTLGNLYIENRNYDKANRIFDAFDKKYGVNEESTLLSVKSLMASGKFSEAQVKMEQLLQQKPDELIYNGLLAEIFRGKGENDNAREVYSKLINGNPDNGGVQLSLADFFISEKNFDDLFGLLNTIVMNEKIRREDKINLFARLIQIPELITDKDNRLTISLMVLEATYKQDDIVPMLRPDLLYRQGKLSEAAARFEELIKGKPDIYPYWEKLLLVYLEMGDYQKLTQRGEECSKKFNMSFIAKVLYANGALETGKYEVALDELKKADILAGNNPDYKVQVLTMKADTYYRMKEYDQAFGFFEEAMKFKKDDPTILNNYAYYLAEQNVKLKEAEELARQVIEKEKDNTTFLDTYAWVLYKRGKVREAAKIMESVITSGNKPDAEWYEHYGYILKKMNKCSKAVESWKEAVQLDKNKTGLLKEIENCEK